MPRNEEAKRKWRQTMANKYGENWGSKFASKAGKASTPGGFGTDKVGKDGLTGKERATKFGVLNHKKKEE